MGWRRVGCPVCLFSVLGGMVTIPAPPVLVEVRVDQFIVEAVPSGSGLVLRHTSLSASAHDEVDQADHTGGITVSNPLAEIDACEDSAYNFWHHVVDGTFSWRYNSNSAPPGLSLDTEAVKESATNITTVNNNCGRADNVSATQSYAGTTTLHPNIGTGGACLTNDGVNVVGWGDLPSGSVATASGEIRHPILMFLSMAMSNSTRPIMTGRPVPALDASIALTSNRS